MTPPEAQGRAPTWRIVLALLGVALAFVPLLGLVLAGGALALGVRDRRAGRPTRPALSIAVLGVVLGGASTAAFAACAPSRETPAERSTWEAFDRLFLPRSPLEPGNPQENPGEGPAQEPPRP